ncbi:MAG: hypothetical protein R6U32_06830 [Candidatus Woesearchaeota archaeon]
MEDYYSKDGDSKIEDMSHKEMMDLMGRAATTWSMTEHVPLTDGPCPAYKTVDITKNADGTIEEKSRGHSFERKVWDPKKPGEEKVYDYVGGRLRKESTFKVKAETKRSLDGETDIERKRILIREDEFLF